jgi:hypothetical protein
MGDAAAGLRDGAVRRHVFELRALVGSPHYCLTALTVHSLQLCTSTSKGQHLRSYGRTT